VSLPFFLGSVMFRNDEAYEALDAFYEAGGRDIDTARGYPGAESVIGGWLDARGVAGEMRVLTKGGHPDPATWASRLTEAEIVADLDKSLETLGLQSIESFLLHRDDPGTPVEQIATILSALVATGRVNTIGVSNWSAPRIRALAAALTTASGPPITWVSNAFGLAQIHGPSPFRGVVTASPDVRRAGRELGFRILAWSAMSQGYFASGRGVDAPIFASEENARRREVLERISAAHGVSAVGVLAHWLMTANDDIVPIFGPTTASHVRELADAAAGGRLDSATAELVSELGEAIQDPGEFAPDAP